MAGVVITADMCKGPLPPSVLTALTELHRVASVELDAALAVLEVNILDPRGAAYTQAYQYISTLLKMKSLMQTRGFDIQSRIAALLRLLRHTPVQIKDCHDAYTNNPPLDEHTLLRTFVRNLTVSYYK
jgi:hypothetical protein